MPFTQQAPASALAVYHGRRAPEIEIHRRHGVLLQFPGGLGQRHWVIADELGDGRATGGVFDDGPQDGSVERAGAVHPEILGPIDIRPTVAGHDTPEGQVRDILHRGQRQHRLGSGQQTSKGQGPVREGPTGNLDGSWGFHGGQSSTLESRLRRSWTA